MAFRNALGAFITGVTAVTTCGPDGKPVGLTANSFNSVSLDPPMVLWSLALNAGSLAAFRDAKWWAVHILGSDQEALSARFAKRGIDKFAGLEVGRGPGGIPLIDDCAAGFVCRTAFEYEGGDHAIFVGEVVAFEIQGAPLWHSTKVNTQGCWSRRRCRPRRRRMKHSSAGISWAIIWAARIMNYLMK